MDTKAVSKSYPLIPPQEMINFMLKYSFFHKQVTQIPASITVNKEIDFDVLNRALNIEIERNDCLRLRFYKEKGEFRQYFLDEFKLEPIPVVTFKSKSEQEQFLESDAQTPIRHMKGKTFRIILFKSFDGRCGIYINVTHLCMDAAAVFVFFADLLAVYDHLKDGTKMPKPLGKYEDLIQKELAYVNDKDRFNADEKFYEEFFKSQREPLYSGVHGPELLEKERAKKKNPNLCAPSCFDPIHDKAVIVKRSVPKKESDIIMGFCEKNNVSPERLIQLGMHLHLAKLNWRNTDHYFVTLCPRRTTLSEKRCGGTMAEPLPWRIEFPEDLTFMQALDKTADVQTQLFRHMNYPYLSSRELVRKIYNYSPFAASSTMMFSWFPLEGNTMNGWEYEFEGYNLGRYIMPLYSFAMKDTHNNCLKSAYMFRTNMITEEHINAMHDNMIKALITGAKNPEMTLGEIIDTL